MNLTDAMLLERMQQMAASMALPQIGGLSQNAQPKTNKDGVSFQDLMDRAQSGKETTPAQKTSSSQDTQKSEQADETAPAQEVKGKPLDKDDPRIKEMDPHMQALVAAGIAVPMELENGTVMMSIPAGELPCVTMTALQLNGEPDLNYPIVVQTGSGQVFKVWLDGEEPVVERSVLTPEESARFQDALLQETRETESGTETVVLPRETPKAETHTGDSAQSGQEDQDGEERFQTTVIREPLFKAFEGTPVKVGENFHTVDTQAPDMDAQLAQAIQQAAQSGEQSMIIKLTPENLGNLTIQLTQSGDGALQVVLHASSAKAAGVLSEHLDSLNLALQNLSGSPVKVEVQRHENSQQAQQHAFQQADPDGHNRQQQQQQRQREEDRSEDFIQQLRLGLFKLEDIF